MSKAPKKNVVNLTDKNNDIEDAEMVPESGPKSKPVDPEKSLTVRHSELMELLRVAEMGGVSRSAHATENAHKVLSLKAIQEIKDSKAYKHIPYQDPDGKIYHCETFRVYCEKVLGRSYPRVNSDLNSLAKFGQRPLEIMYHAGVGVREKEQMQRLPEEYIESFTTEIAEIVDMQSPESKQRVREIVGSLIREKLDIKEELEEEKKNSYRLGKTLDRKALEEKIEKDKAASRQAPPWPELVLRIREESAAAAMIAVGSLDDIERLMSDLVAGGDALVGAKNGKADYDAAASAIGLNLSMIVSRVSQVMSLAHSMGLSDYLDDQDQNVTLLTDTEAESVRTRWQVMLNDAADAQKHRVAARNGKVSRGRRGRPKGSKNKSKDA